MSSNLFTAFLGLCACAVIAAGCSNMETRQSPWSFEEPAVEKKPLPPIPEEKVKQDQESFGTLGAKIDEYQELVAACDSLAPTEENKEIKDRCARRLKELRQELIDLAGPQQEQGN